MNWRLPTPFHRRIRDDRGQDLIEYALLVSLIVIVAIAGVKNLGDTVSTVLWDVIANFHV